MVNKMKLKFVKDDDRIRLVDQDNHFIGNISYQQEDNILYVTHTYVEMKHREQGYAKDLVDELVKYARKKHFKIVPKCSYVFNLFNTDESYQDIYYQD